MWGSGVKGWIDNPAFSDYPDLGSVGVSDTMDGHRLPVTVPGTHHR